MNYRILKIMLAVIILVLAVIIVVMYLASIRQYDSNYENEVDLVSVEQVSYEEPISSETQNPWIITEPEEDFIFDESNPDYREAMRRWVMTISEIAKKRDSDFIIIPQNCSPLLTDSGEVDGRLYLYFVDAIDGLGQESTNFGSGGYNNKRSDERYEKLTGLLNLAKQNGLSILSIDYCDTKDKIETAQKNNDALGYIGFQAEGFELTKIQPLTHNINDKDIENLSQAENMMFLLNPQEFGEKEEYINMLCETNYDILVIDANFNNVDFITSSDVNRLKRKASGATRLVISYLSIGEAEDYRYYWKDEYDDFSPEWMLTENPEWEGNYPVMYWNEEWQEIIATQQDSYLNRIIDANFDGVFLDIVDGYQTFED